jgi:hypothetical protein
VLFVACSNNAPSDRVTCEQFYEHADKITHFETKKPYSAGEIQYCESHSQEQLRCVLAATSTDQLSLCEIADTSQRAIAARVLPQIRKAWPGTASVNDVVAQGKAGCAFFSIVAGAVPPTENEVRGAFAFRRKGQGGDPTNVIVRLRRAGDDWTCMDEGDAVSCEELGLACRSPARVP